MTNEESQRELAMAWGAELAARVSALEIIVALDAIDLVLDNGQWIGALRLSVLRAHEQRIERARDEAQVLLGRALDCLALKGHSMGREDWLRACLLGGRTGFDDMRDDALGSRARAEADRHEATKRAEKAEAERDDARRFAGVIQEQVNAGWRELGEVAALLGYERGLEEDFGEVDVVDVRALAVETRIERDALGEALRRLGVAEAERDQLAAALAEVRERVGVARGYAGLRLDMEEEGRLTMTNEEQEQEEFEARIEETARQGRIDATARDLFARLMETSNCGAVRRETIEKVALGAYLSAEVLEEARERWIKVDVAERKAGR